MTRLSAGFSNNINVIAIRAFGSTTQVVTDRAIDLDGDGSKEQTTITTEELGSGTKTRQTVTEPAGIGHSVVDRSTEPDGGSLDDTGLDDSEGLG